MMIIILLMLFIGILIGSYFLFNKEIMQPAVIFCATYTFSILCAVLNIGKWGIELSVKTFLILFIGGLEFCAISYGVYRYFQKKKVITQDTEEHKSIEVSKILTGSLIVIEVILLIVLLMNVLKIASKYGSFNSFSKALTLYKQHTGYSKDDELPGYVAKSIKIITASAYVSMFIFLNNVIKSNGKIGKRILENGIHLVLPLIFCIQKFMESGRGGIVYFLLSTLTMSIVIWSIKAKWKEQIKIKTIAKISLSVCFALILFYLSTPLVGRINKKNLFDYITYYCGGSIECFNQWVEKPDSVEVVRGEYTFAKTIRNLNELKITDYKLNNKNYSKFIYYEKTMVGNIYTAYRSWMHDWGIPGAIILQAIFAIIVNLLYNMIKYGKQREYINDLLIILYGYISYTIYMHPIDSYFYLHFFTESTIAIMVMIVLLYFIATNIKIEKKNGITVLYKNKLVMENFKWKKMM